MTKYYLLVPLALLAGFAVYHHVFSQQRTKEEKAHAERRAIAKQADEERLAGLRAAAQAAGAQRLEEKQKADRDRAEKKRRDYESALATIVDTAGRHRATAAELAAETANVEQQLAALRARQAKQAADISELARAVAASRIERRNADLEVQQTTSMVLARLHNSPWVSGVPGLPRPATRP